MAYDLPKFESRITVPVGGWAMLVTDSGGTETFTIPAGYYYLTTLLAAIAAGLTGYGALAGTYSAVADDDATASTGRVTLAATGAGNISVTWGSNTLRDLLGYTGNLSGAATHLATDAPQPLFLSDVPIANPMVPDGSRGRLIANRTGTASPDGNVKVLRYGGRRVNAWEWRQMSGRKIWTQFETYDNESLESFWDYALAGGTPFRYHWDRSDNASYTPWVYMGPDAFPGDPNLEGFVGGPGAEGAALQWNTGRIELAEWLGT